MLKKLTRIRKKELRLPELIAIALGGMVGGGIFAILGISVEKIGNATPIAFLVGGVLAFFAAYSYVKLALYTIKMKEPLILFLRKLSLIPLFLHPL
jgi:amino acid transporter